MHRLVASAKEFLKVDQLEKRRMALEDDGQDELQLKRLCLSPRV